MTDLVVDPTDMPGGGARPLAQAAGPRRRRQPHRQSPSLPLDVVLAIAARSDAPTLVRCAATCADARRRLADDRDLHRRLRLRHAGDRFVLPLLRGDLLHTRTAYNRNGDMYLADASAADHGGAATTCRLRKVTTAGYPITSRDGLLLLRMDKDLRVCDPATGRSHAVPLPKLALAPVHVNGEYVLLVRENASAAAASTAGRPFQVLFAYLEVSKYRSYLKVEVHAFSPQRGGAWSRPAEIRTPNLHGSRLLRGLGKALVDGGGAVHWLCLTDAGAYALKLHVKAAQVTVTTLPESVPHTQQRWWHGPPLMAMSSPGGSPVVLVAEGNKILGWTQSKRTGKWKPRPEVVVDADAMVRFVDGAGGTRLLEQTRRELRLEWFAERSGAVLIQMSWDHLFCLDMQSMEIVRWFSDRKTMSYLSRHCPYEMNLSDWAPTFSSTLV